MTQREFMQTIIALAEDVQGINPVATAAHAANESGYGSSGLARHDCNLFGLKKGSSWAGRTVTLPTWEVDAGRTIKTTAEFRSYGSWRESVEDYAATVKRVYPWAARHAHDPLAFLTGVFLIGPSRWATDPEAYVKAVRILEAHGLLDGPGDVQALGRHEVLVDNSPSVRAALATLKASFSRAPAVHGPHFVTRTRRADGTWKLDLRQVE